MYHFLNVIVNVMSYLYISTYIYFYFIIPYAFTMFVYVPMNGLVPEIRCVIDSGYNNNNEWIYIYIYIYIYSLLLNIYIYIYTYIGVHACTCMYISLSLSL